MAEKVKVKVVDSCYLDNKILKVDDELTMDPASSAFKDLFTANRIEVVTEEKEETKKTKK